VRAAEDAKTVTASETAEIVEPAAQGREPELTVVMPCLNEARTIGICIQKALDSFERIGIAGEVVVADNGSTDGSQQIAEELGARVVPVERRGYGAALTGGIAAARGRWVIMGDADDSYDFSELEPFVQQLREGYDLVAGNRFKGGIRPGAMPWLHRRLGNPVLSFIGRRLYGTPCGDIYCGLRGFDREKIAALDIRSTGMEFAIEMIVKATMQGLRVTEVPTTLSPDAEGREPHLNTWTDGWKSVRLLILYSPTWLFLYPGLFLLAFGIAGMAWLIPGNRSIGGVGFDVSTLLYFSLAVTVGLQAVFFFLTARWFGITEGLLPEDHRIRRIVERPRRLEWALLVGLILVAAGLGLSLYAVAKWNNADFGTLNYPDTLRIVIPGATLIACGMQTAFSALFLGVLGLRRR
jgi:cellulose synthase/poly-beta-1,6-N-acetylglucosamine synthase-like glycosyltransferase